MTSSSWLICFTSCHPAFYPVFLHPATPHSKIILNVGDHGFLVLTDRHSRAYLLTFCHTTFYVLPPLLQVFLEAESVAVPDPEVFALVFGVVEPFPEVVVSAAEAEVVSVVPEPEVSAPVFAAAELSP